MTHFEAFTSDDLCDHCYRPRGNHLVGSCPCGNYIILKNHCPDTIDNADHALIELSETLVLLLDRRCSQTRRMYEQDFYGTEWWDFTPDFVTIRQEQIGLPEDVMERAFEEVGFVRLPSMFTPGGVTEFSRMSPILLDVSINQRRTNVGTQIQAGFQWIGFEKYTGIRVETCETPENQLEGWAHIVGCDKLLAKVRSARGEMKIVAKGS